MAQDSLSTRIFKFIKKQCILSFVSLLILVFGSLFIFDSKINPISITFPEAPELIGALLPNEKLTKAKILHFRKIKGCESLVKVNDYIYSTTQDGKIVKFNDTHTEIFHSLHSDLCRNIQECGRPLGIRYDEANRRLLVVDAYHGLFQINMDTGILTKLFPKPNDSFKVTFFNDFDILPTGDVIISESSTKYQLQDLISLILEGRANGRLLKVNPVTGEHEIIIDNLYFPNGVQVYKKDPKIVLVAETLKLRILSVNIDPNCSISERTKIFVNNLPGMPDNIRPSFKKSGYWINFAGIRYSGNSFWMDTLAGFPFIKNCLKKLISDTILHMLLKPNYGMIVRIDEFGNVIESLHDAKGINVTSSSETLEVGDSLYLGNYYLPFIVKVDL